MNASELAIGTIIAGDRWSNNVWRYEKTAENVWTRTDSMRGAGYGVKPITEADSYFKGGWQVV